MIGLQELVLILAILLIVFGPKKLPAMVKEFGRVIRELNKTRTNIIDTVSSALKDGKDDNEGDAVAKIAANLGINSKEKSTKQLLEEIEKKTVKNGKNSNIQGK